MNKVKILNVSYNSQRDNTIKPLGACNITTLWMQFSKYFTEKNITDDDLMRFMNSPVAVSYFNSLPSLRWAVVYRNQKKLEQVWAMLEWAGCVLCGFIKERLNFKHILNELDSETVINNVNVIYQRSRDLYNFTFLTFDEIFNSIENGLPVITGGKFTSSGHFVLIIGFEILNNVKHIVINDPYGDPTIQYQSTNGQNRVLTAAFFDKKAYKNDNFKYRVLRINPAMFDYLRYDLLKS